MGESGQRYVFMNNKYVPEKEAKVSIFDHGFLYGDGIFEGIRVYSGNVFRLKEHIDRLYDSAKSIMLHIPMTKKEMMESVVETVRKNELEDAYIRLVISRGEGDLSLNPDSCHEPQIIIVASKVKIFTKEMHEKGLKVVTVPTRRNNPDALNPKIKSLNYLNNVLIRIEANQAGAGEGLTLTSDGYVSEGSGDNIFIIKNNKIFTPPTYLGALEGITRQAIMDIADKLGYLVYEQPFTRHDVFVADEVFLTGTAAEVIAVSEVDGRLIGNGGQGTITKKLLEEFQKLVTEDGVKIYDPIMKQAL